MEDNAQNPAVIETVEYLKEKKFDESLIDRFSNDFISVLNDYSKLVGAGTEFTYFHIRRFTRIDIKVVIPGDDYDPFEEGEGARARIFRRVIRLNLNTEAAAISHQYVAGKNVISISIPLSVRRRSLLKSPTLIATVAGLVLGFGCRSLPADVCGFIVNDLASPFMKVILNCLSGIMGPVVFISLVTSVVAMDNINDLTDLGFKIVRRFLTTILFVSLVSLVVSAFFFTSIGSNSISFSANQLVQIIFDLIPVNLFAPFLENNTGQLVILGLLLGASLLVLGDQAKELKKILFQINEWMMSAMKMVLILVPLVPFLSIFTMIANNQSSKLLEGWKFIAASYITFAICCVVKIFKTSARSGIDVGNCWKKIKPAVSLAFKTSSTSTTISQVYEISDKDFDIKPEFSSFWIPMSSAMLSLKTTVNVTIATLMAASMSDIAVTPSFLIVLLLVTIELSLASPGTVSAWAIMFETFGLPSEYVGLFSLYRIFTNNFNCGAVQAYGLLEEVEAAHVLGCIKDKEDI